MGPRDTYLYTCPWTSQGDTVSPGGTPIVLTAPPLTPSCVPCLPKPRSQSHPGTAHSHMPRHQFMIAASLARVGDGRFAGVWLGVARAGGAPSPEQLESSPPPDLPSLYFSPQASSGATCLPHRPLPEAALLTWSLDPLGQDPLAWRKASNRSREQRRPASPIPAWEPHKTGRQPGIPLNGIVQLPTHPFGFIHSRNILGGPSVQAQEMIQT